MSSLFTSRKFKSRTTSSWTKSFPIESIAAKVVKCNVCKDEYPENQIEQHLVGVHGLSGPKEMYTKLEDSDLFRGMNRIIPNILVANLFFPAKSNSLNSF